MAERRRAFLDARRPRGLVGLVRWYASCWADEAPIRLHERGVWHDKHASSALGTPQDTARFRAWLHLPAFETDHDGYFLRPTSAALYRLAANDRVAASERGAMALYLWRLAYLGFDWRALGATYGMPEPVAATYTRVALEALWLAWTPSEHGATMQSTENVQPPGTIPAGREAE